MNLSEPGRPLTPRPGDIDAADIQLSRVLTWTRSGVSIPDQGGWLLLGGGGGGSPIRRRHGHASRAMAADNHAIASRPRVVFCRPTHVT